jgi:predicted nucleic acid-binding protein
MKAVVYDSGALIAAERNDRTMWAEHRVRLETGIVPSVPAPVVAQVSRSPSQAQLRRLLRGCDIVSFGERDAHRAGAVLARSRSSDVVDAAVVVIAADRGAAIVTSDPKDIARLATAARAFLRILPIAIA